MVASGTNARVAYIAESTRGSTPGSPNFTVQRAISRNINLKRDTIESQEVSASRQRSDVRHGFNRIEGDIQVELSMETYNFWLLWATSFNNWLAPASATGASHTLSVTGTNAFTRVTGNWIDDGYRPGDWIRTTAFTTGANNGDHRVITVTATVLTTASVLVNEAGVSGSTVAYIGKKAVVGDYLSGLKTMSLEREILDLDAAGIDLYQIFRGVCINRLAVSARPNAMLSATFGLLGMIGTINSAATIDTNAVYTDAPTNSPLAGVDASVYFGAFAANSTEFDFTLDNQRTTAAILGNRNTVDIYEGVAKVTGSLSILMLNATHQANFQNETVQTQGFQIRVNELGTSDFLVFNFGRVKYTLADIDPPSNGPVAQKITWEALEQAYQGSVGVFRETMTIQRSTST